LALTFDTCHKPHPQQIPMNGCPRMILACSQLLSAAAEAWSFPLSATTSQANHRRFMCLHCFCLPLSHYVVCRHCFQSYSPSFASSANFIPSSSCLPEQGPITWSLHLVLLCLPVLFCYTSGPLAPQPHPLYNLRFLFPS